MKTTNPSAAKLLIWATKNCKSFPRLHRVICIFLNSDVFCQIPSGLTLPHPYGIIIHSKALIGENTTIMQQVTIGGKNWNDPVGVPVIGNNCYIGAGAKILGAVKVGNNVTIGANAVITKDVSDGCVAVGVNQIVKKP
jgi:serine O-acetyltransferase